MAISVNGGCEIYYESFGDPADPTLMLVNGLGSQCTNYHEDWCEMFAARGLRVVRFDSNPSRVWGTTIRRSCGTAGSIW